MWKKVLNWIFGILLLVSLIFNGYSFYLIRHLDAPGTIYLHDTVTIHTNSIQEKIVYNTKFDTITEIRYKDTVLYDTIEIPVEHKVSEFKIEKDSLKITLQIYHSGFHSTIDSIKLDYNWNYEIPKPKPKKFGWSITFGPSINYGITLDTQNKTWTHGPSAGFSIVIGPSFIIK